ncbi:tRNA (adenosine(37)-N6)-dimethylallyltransferase MiaA [Lysinibacillus fusiformis]|jgi:tRNA dimethylallyltransferase|uniref:tRNA (adenosine(37)-N6)-dimethylallyltransferase MiaA n=1 Tax=Lysinibacillus TaxID=400634 RepID=UPI0004DA0AAC|nr:MULTISPECIES: tRNA (adenosine(37)-N6)-dimethylallyltransferase MiaA [Lysinibacillus]MDC6268806.1 tRNA (adenosine(37)-N6)-dimethylallyltransferase MiaA [Lysinibacillus sphaericus]AJK88879.1 tRNA delta(2)-isopentenylpyrophosphate transferase [Lysinibacillus fusiformis]KAB0441741.1 tRNA dimethylallyltransferase [Lysinibacillus fusiformis]KGA82912.1 tRNA delta(2)-isopentenylpyrophosphate transferase [Lysinibacillus fusiformis]KHK52684.1 tRNA delta(2)-isopentenylpyrophosphate transferase [Lysini
MIENKLQQAEVVAIVGPTASGKTALSIELAKKYNGEIINGDSMQVYKGLDIGTAKITEEEMEGVPHHLLSFLEPTESFSVADYQKLVRAKIADIQARHKLPIIVGGSGLYVQAVLFDFQFTDEKVDEAARQAYYDELAKLGPEAMHDKLKQLDPQTAEAIHPNNTRRVIRALEMLELNGVSKAAEAQNRGEVPLYNHLILGLGQNMSRDVLYDRINRRVDLMMENGLLEEVRGLWQQNIRGVQSIQAIGYKELYDYLDGKCSLEGALDSLKQNSRRYAKRQLTYFRNKMDVHFVMTDEQL